MADRCVQLHDKRLASRVIGAALCPTMDLAAFTLQDATVVIYVRDF